jgi:CRISPR-associated protein Cmr4
VMEQRASLFFVRAVTPVHVGVDIGLGAVNLPTMREAITRHPLIPGSSFKGVLRDLSDVNDPKTEDAVEGDAAARPWAAFGPTRNRAGDYRGGLVFSDARLLLLPLASLRGTFAWTTSRAVLRRCSRDLRDAGITSPLAVPGGDDVRVTTGSRLPFDDGRVSLREVLTKATRDDAVDALAARLAPWIWREEDRGFFTERLAVLPDEVFDAFARSALELRARVAIDDATGTAESSGPWTEEHIPAESILSGVALGRATTWREALREGVADAKRREKKFSPEEMLSVFEERVGDGKTLRIGGHSGVGLGRVHMTCTRGA